MKPLADKAERAVSRLADDYRKACRDMAEYRNEIGRLTSALTRAEIENERLSGELQRALYVAEVEESTQSVLAAFETGEKGVTASPSEVRTMTKAEGDFVLSYNRVTFEPGEGEPGTRVRLGVCGGGEDTGMPGCGEFVLSGQRFHMVQLAWSADFLGDVPGRRIVFTHRDCADQADHRMERAR